MFNGKIHYKWPFSIAMLVHQRVNIPAPWILWDCCNPPIEVSIVAALGEQGSRAVCRRLRDRDRCFVVGTCCNQPLKYTEIVF